MAIAPEMVSAYVTRGLTYEKKKDYRRMVGDTSQAISFGGVDAFNYAGRDKAYLAMGKLLQARKVALTAAKLEPKNPQHRELIRKIEGATAEPGP